MTDLDQKRPMHLVVLGHPSPTSFNAAIAAAYIDVVHARHQRTEFRDLYALGFDPLLKEEERTASDGEKLPEDARRELDLALAADVILFVYPLWFGAPPAIVKGYLDRVFGAASRTREFYDPGNSQFADKRLAVISTSGASLPWLEGQGVWVSLKQSFDRYLKVVVGFAEVEHYHADGIVDGLGPAHAERVLYEVAQFADRMCAAPARSGT
ncbi:NAD(P)H-dependent oxidoreductase [Sphingomonas sp. LY29]|uniref:NAD(P)H-dependent oxidoreductase n=1 Tax=Sphingomonas sp. LY29 TaxID=3095341 RepID=UPI002D78DF2E|nr:NAD(P)H-dependent oxidoreductase [Sphingomonas sp. LY29]WRP25033.1 NAD(P)H-dependent oxidoreductase [Sphingomonas sp. LY29]